MVAPSLGDKLPLEVDITFTDVTGERKKIELADEANLVIHAMPLRPTFYDLLPQTREDMP